MFEFHVFCFLFVEKQATLFKLLFSFAVCVEEVLNLSTLRHELKYFLLFPSHPTHASLLSSVFCLRLSRPSDSTHTHSTLPNLTQSQLHVSLFLVCSKTGAAIFFFLHNCSWPTKLCFFMMLHAKCTSVHFGIHHPQHGD